jgi:hypothetical protein
MRSEKREMGNEKKKCKEKRRQKEGGKRGREERRGEEGQKRPFKPRRPILIGLTARLHPEEKYPMSTPVLILCLSLKERTLDVTLKVSLHSIP